MAVVQHFSLYNKMCLNEYWVKQPVKELGWNWSLRNEMYSATSIWKIVLLYQQLSFVTLSGLSYSYICLNSLSAVSSDSSHLLSEFFPSLDIIFTTLYSLTESATSVIFILTSVFKDSHACAEHQRTRHRFLWKFCCELPSIARTVVLWHWVSVLHTTVCLTV